MKSRRKGGITTQAALLLCAFTCLRAVVEPQQQLGLGFVQAFSSAPLQRTRPRRRSDDHASSPPTRHESRAGQKSNRHRRLAGVPALKMARSWSNPPLEEVSVTQLPVLGSTAVAVVYFTACDLRVHDHDALVATAGAAGVLPVYVFDDMVTLISS